MQTRFLTNPYLYELIEDNMIDRAQFEGVMSAIMLIAYHIGLLQNNNRRELFLNSMKGTPVFMTVPRKELREIYETYCTFVEQEQFREKMLQNIRELNPEDKEDDIFYVNQAFSDIEAHRKRGYAETRDFILREHGVAHGNSGDIRHGNVNS